MRRSACGLIALGAALAIATGVAYNLAWNAAAAANRIAGRALEAAAARCSPVYAVIWPEFGCSARLGWPPIKCAPEVHVYRHTDPARVRAKIQKVGQQPGMIALEERGIQEKTLPISWLAQIGGVK